MLSSKELQDYYAKKYHQEGKGSYELEYSEQEQIYFNAKLEQRWGILQRCLKLSKNERRLLYVGCGEGYVLAFFRKLGLGRDITAFLCNTGAEIV